MSSYLDGLNPIQKQNASILISRMAANGITNPNTQAAILAVISKESEFVPQSENLNYKADTIARVFKQVPANLIPSLAGNPQALGDYVYSPSYNPSLGNGVGEGYKYRGRGYNQLTGKANYKKIGDEIGVDLVSNPDALNDPKNAADAAIAFFKDGVNSLAKMGKLSQYNSTGINDFKTAQDSLGAIYNVNAGIGSTKAKIDADVTGGKAKAESRISDILSFVTSAVSSAATKTTTTIKQNPITSIFVTAGIIVLSYFFFKVITKK